MSGIAEIITQLDDRAMATVDIPLAEGEDQRLNCILKKAATPSFKLIFPSNTLPLDRLEYGRNCRLIVKNSGSQVNLNVRLDEADDDRTLIFTAVESINPEMLREYFRVMISAPVRASYQPGAKEIKNKSWELNGHTIDISGGGVLALFPGKPGNSKRINLEISLPNQQEPIVCQAKIVHTYRMRKKRYQVAFTFEHLEGKTRDIIISCCLQEQRRQLRDKVRVE